MAEEDGKVHMLRGLQRLFESWQTLSEAVVAIPRALKIDFGGGTLNFVQIPRILQAIPRDAPWCTM